MRPWRAARTCRKLQGAGTRQESSSYEDGYLWALSRRFITLSFLFRAGLLGRVRLSTTVGSPKSAAHKSGPKCPNANECSNSSGKSVRPCRTRLSRTSASPSLPHLPALGRTSRSSTCSAHWWWFLADGARGTYQRTSMGLSACFHEVEMPAEEAEQDDSHNAAQGANENHHALANRGICSEIVESQAEHHKPT